jgi:hypothetical protein
MAAVNVAVTKTPVSTSIILSVLSGTSMLPVIAITSFVSFILTSQITLIKTQRCRDLEEVNSSNLIKELTLVNEKPGTIPAINRLKVLVKGNS